MAHQIFAGEGLGQILDLQVFIQCSVAEVAGAHGWHPPKSLDSDEKKPKHTILCRELRFVAIYALFGDLWVKNSVSWARSALLHGIYCIFY